MNDSFEVAGFKLNDLCDKYGSPLFVYDGGKIVDQFNSLNNALKVKNKKINYACKALTNISVLRLMKSLGAGLDTVSIQEIEIGLKAGFSPHDIIYTPNSVSAGEIEKAMEIGVKVNIDNIEHLEYFGHKTPNYPICIRINPHIMAGGNQKISVGHIDSKFGISIYQLPLVKRLVETLNINIEGIHMHTGSDILDNEVFLQASEILFDAARNFPSIQYLDFGSGFKVKYRLGDVSTDIKSFGSEISTRFNSFCKEIGKDLTLMFEPGKFLVSESGYFLVHANVIKQTTSTIFVGVDSGFNHMIRPMFYDAYHEITNISNPGGRKRVYTIVGYICETDTFGWNRMLEEVRVGDVLVFKNAGAYCFSMASNYNSRPKPAEVLIFNGKDYLIREREVLDDLLVKQRDPKIDFELV